MRHGSLTLAAGLVAVIVLAAPAPAPAVAHVAAGGAAPAWAAPAAGFEIAQQITIDTGHRVSRGLARPRG